MPLIIGDSGQEYEIRKIGGNDEIRKHLASMGFVPGTKVTLVSVKQLCSLLISSKTRFAGSE